MTEAKPSVGLSVLAAMLALGGLPVGFGFLLVATRGVEDVSSVWVEGGWGMYPVLLLAMVTALLSAVGAFLAPRGVPGVMAAALAATVAVMGVSAFSYGNAAGASFDAIQHASPADQPMIMRGALGEIASLVLLASALIAGLLLMQGVALMVGAAAARASKGALLSVGLALVALGAWQFFMALNAGAERDFFAALAHASPMDRLTLAADGLERLASSAKQGLGPLLAALVIVVAGTVSLRRNRRAAAAVVFGVLVPLSGLGGLRAWARPSAKVLELATSQGKVPELMQLEATPLDEKAYRLVTLGRELRGDDGEPLTFEQLKNTTGLSTIAVGLEPGVKGPAVLDFLRQLQKAGTTMVTLVGQKRTEPPSFVPAAWQFVFNERRALEYELVAGSACERCTFASVTEKGLVVDGETWPLATSSFVFVPDETDKVYVKTEGLTLEQVLSVGHTVAAKSLRPVLVLPE